MDAMIIFNTTGDTTLNGSSLGQVNDVRILETTFLIYKIGDWINKLYFPILVPVGVVGNVLSFLVMMQRHNRKMSFSLYISALAVTDTVSLLLVIVDYLNQLLNVAMPLDNYWHCAVLIAFGPMSTLCSTLFVVAMTFERFYSIIRPHKAASFNTVQRAKITIVCSVIFSFVFHFPHLFITTNIGEICIPYGEVMAEFSGQFYYWLSFVISFSLPFVLLLTMNSVIIHTLRKRSILSVSMSVTEGQGQSQGHSQGPKLKKSERQIYITLLFITFAFLIFTTPIYTHFLYIMFYDYTKSAETFAGYYFYYNVAAKMFYTNNGINFFLYVVSGQKFRSDLRRLFRCNGTKSEGSVSHTSGIKTIETNVSENQKSILQ